MRAIIALAGAAGLALGWLLWGRPAEVAVPPVAPGIDSAAVRADSLAATVGTLSDSLTTLAERLRRASRPRPAAPLPPRPADPDLPAYADTLEARVGADSITIATLRGDLAAGARAVQSAADSARAAAGRLTALSRDLVALGDRARALESERDALARRVRSLSRPWSVGVGGGIGSDGRPVLGVAAGLTGRLAFLRIDLHGVAGTGPEGPAGMVVGRVGL